MLKIGFTPDMLKILKSMKGKVFKSFECYFIGEGDIRSLYGSFRINLGRSSVDITCDYELFNFAGIEEEYCPFSCTQADPSSKFIPWPLDVEPKEYMVDEVITGVEVLKDQFEINGAKMEMDMALAIQTKYHKYIFSHTYYYSDIIHFRILAPNATVDTTESISELWLDDLTPEEAFKADGRKAKRIIKAL